jgi:hypothetical protein
LADWLTTGQLVLMRGLEGAVDVHVMCPQATPPISVMVRVKLDDLAVAVQRLKEER